jgi:hypothetical protein
MASAYYSVPAVKRMSSKLSFSFLSISFRKGLNEIKRF